MNLERLNPCPIAKEPGFFIVLEGLERKAPVGLTKGYFILAVLTWSLVFPFRTSLGFQNEPEDFRGIKWGTPIDQLPDMVFHAQSGESKVYFRKNDKLKIGAADLLQIWYFFSMDSLYSVVITFEEFSNYNALKAELFKRYGAGYPLESFNEKYRWMGSDVIIFLDYDEINEQGQLSYFYLPAIKSGLKHKDEEPPKSENDY